MFEKLLQYFYFAQKTAGWILNCHDDGDKQTQKFLGCVLPQGNRILFLSCGSNFIVSPKKITDERHPQCAGPPHASVTMSSPVSTRWTKDQDQTSCSTKLVPRRVSTWATWQTRPCFIATLAVGLSPAYCAWHLMTWMCLSASFKVSCFLVQHIVVTSLHPWTMDEVHLDGRHRFHSFGDPPPLFPLLRCWTEWFEFPTTPGPTFVCYQLHERNF